MLHWLQSVRAEGYPRCEDGHRVRRSAGEADGADRGRPFWVPVFDQGLAPKGRRPVSVLAPRERAGVMPGWVPRRSPRRILVGAQREFCRTWPGQSEVTVPGLHFIQEDCGPQIGQAIASWLARPA
jgi:hypothetical protein